MKKYLILLPLVVLASGCVQKQASKYTPPPQNQTTPEQLEQVYITPQVHLGVQNPLENGSQVYTNTREGYGYAINLPNGWLMVSRDNKLIPITETNDATITFKDPQFTQELTIASTPEVREGETTKYCNPQKQQRLIGRFGNFISFSGEKTKCYVIRDMGQMYELAFKNSENDLLVLSIIETFRMSKYAQPSNDGEIRSCLSQQDCEAFNCTTQAGSGCVSSGPICYQGWCQCKKMCY